MLSLAWRQRPQAPSGSQQPSVLRHPAPLAVLTHLQKSAWYSAGSDGCVREYSAGTSELVGHVLEIAGSIEANGLAVNPAGTRIAVAAGYATPVLRVEHAF